MQLPARVEKEVNPTGCSRRPEAMLEMKQTPRVFSNPAATSFIIQKNFMEVKVFSL